MQGLSRAIWCNYFDVGVAALIGGRPETAETMFAAALAEAEYFDLCAVHQVASLHGLACAYLKSGRKGASEVLLRKAFRIVCQAEEINPEDLSTIACQLADSYLEQGEPAKAMPILKTASNQISRREGNESPALARLLKRIALIYSRCGRADKADHHFTRAANLELKWARVGLGLPG